MRPTSINVLLILQYPELLIFLLAAWTYDNRRVRLGLKAYQLRNWVAIFIIAYLAFALLFMPNRQSSGFTEL